jgi:hypothetical protein
VLEVHLLRLYLAELGIATEPGHGSTLIRASVFDTLRPSPQSVGEFLSEWLDGAPVAQAEPKPIAGQGLDAVNADACHA